MPTLRSSRGYSLLELVFIAGVAVTLGAAAVPQLLATLDDIRAAGAARYIATRFHRARMEAVVRSSSVALQFTLSGGGYAYAEYVDGNGNGVLSREIQSGVDKCIRPAEALPQQFAGVDFGATADLPPVNSGGTPPGTDPVRLGSSNSLSFSPLGTSTAGTVYIRGRGGAQYAVTVFGETGKIRLVKFNRATGRWGPL